MDRLSLLFEQYNRWQVYNVYIQRINAQKETDFPSCVENAKSLLEGIGKQICSEKGQVLQGDESVSKVLNLAFGCLGYCSSDTIRQIGASITNIAQQLGNYRNEVGITSHGRTIEELETRKTNISNLTAHFLISSLELVCCFLIETFETDNPRFPKPKEILFEEQEEFNSYWDEQFGEFVMGDYSYSASEILFNCDPEAYKTEATSFATEILETSE